MKFSDLKTKPRHYVNGNVDFMKLKYVCDFVVVVCVWLAGDCNSIKNNNNINLAANSDQRLRYFSFF